MACLRLLGEFRRMACGIGDVWAGSVAGEVDAPNNLAVGKVVVFKFVSQGEQVHLGMGVCKHANGNIIIKSKFYKFFCNVPILVELQDTLVHVAHYVEPDIYLRDSCC